ncbi:MAG: DUF433 domain-containing protein [Saprospiraceae bacterium]
MDYTQWIEINPAIMLGKPVIRGTRLTIELILEELSNCFFDLLHVPLRAYFNPCPSPPNKK